MALTVTNINGTAAHECACGTWLEHYRKFSRSGVAIWCAEAACLSTDVVGAHVQKRSDVDRDWYIVPLCKKHNGQASSLVLGDVELVPANIENTCGRSTR